MVSHCAIILHPPRRFKTRLSQGSTALQMPPSKFARCRFSHTRGWITACVLREWQGPIAAVGGEYLGQKCLPVHSLTAQVPEIEVVFPGGENIVHDLPGAFIVGQIADLFDLLADAPLGWGSEAG